MSGTRAAEATALRERGRKLGIIGDDWTSLLIEAFEAYVAASPGPLSAADWLDVLLTNIEREGEA
jgi:hypothetical protein